MSIPGIYNLIPLMFLLVVNTAASDTRAVVEIEVTKGKDVKKSSQIITYGENRVRIDFSGERAKVTRETPYIMTVDGGKTWVLGDKPKDKFYCSKMQTEAFFRNVGDQVTRAMDFFNVTATHPTVKKILEEPGPKIKGHETMHLQLETNAAAYAWIIFFKVDYTVRIVDDIWYAKDLDMHPIKRKWINALKQSGNSVIDNLIGDYTANLSGPVLKTETVIEIKNVKKKDVKIQKKRTKVTKIKELQADEIFAMPECIEMDDDEVKKKAKALFSSGRIML